MGLILINPFSMSHFGCCLDFFLEKIAHVVLEIFKLNGL